jgi:hypothetical protein
MLKSWQGTPVAPSASRLFTCHIVVKEVCQERRQAGFHPRSKGRGFLARNSIREVEEKHMIQLNFFCERLIYKVSSWAV